MKKRNRILLLFACFTLLFVGSTKASETNVEEHDAFIQGCLKSTNSKTEECECMYRDTSVKLPENEAAFLIASMSENMPAIQESAKKLSPEQIMAVLSTSWLEIVESCLTN